MSMKELEKKYGFGQLGSVPSSIHRKLEQITVSAEQRDRAIAAFVASTYINRYGYLSDYRQCESWNKALGVIVPDNILAIYDREDISLNDLLLRVNCVPLVDGKITLEEPKEENYSGYLIVELDESRHWGAIQGYLSRNSRDNFLDLLESNYL